MVKLKKRVCELAMKKNGRLAEVNATVEAAASQHQFPQLMEPEPALSGKNALHVAAWKGDFETIQYFIDQGRRHKLDLINVVSIIGLGIIANHQYGMPLRKTATT
jgi:hypothetical protein